MTKALYNILEFLARNAHSLFFKVLEISGTPMQFFFYYVAPMAVNTWRVTRIEKSNTSPCYIDWPSALKLAEFAKRDRIYKTYISDFYIYGLRSGQFCDLPVISQWEKIHLILVCVKTTPSRQNMQNIVLASHWSWQVHRWPLQWAVEVAWRQHRSPTVSSQ